jgi:hypothetical protein
MSPRDRDIPWTEVADHHLPAPLALLAPAVHCEIDWSHDFEPLEQGLRKMAPGGGAGKRLAEKLIKARARTGGQCYLQVEVQAQPEEGLERRLCVYHYRGDDRFGAPPEAIAVRTRARTGVRRAASCS